MAESKKTSQGHFQPRVACRRAPQAADTGYGGHAEESGEPDERVDDDEEENENEDEDDYEPGTRLALYIPGIYGALGSR
jgi:hypothetical protein